MTAVAVLYFVRIYYRLHDLKSDESLFTSELRSSPEYIEGLTDLALTYDLQARHLEANALWRRTLEYRPEQISYTNLDVIAVSYANNLLALQRPADAYHLLRRFAPELQSEQAHQEAAYNLAVAAVRLGKYDEAVPLLLRYTATHQLDARAALLLGISARGSGEITLARSAFEEFLKLTPSAPERSLVERWLAEL